MKAYWWYRYYKLGVKLGFTIGYNSLGYGVLIPHHGTIVVNGNARVGNFAVLHTCTCIAGKKEIGDYLYFSTGSQIVGNINLGDGITVASHSLVNHSEDSNLLLAGVPAVVKRLNYTKWPETDRVYNSRVQRVKTLFNRFYS
ncbi:serine O-acetyltransferase [Xylanibacter ruminicola]|uniref:serine O-acetyltransferase n=1 Tax=Xylanibacter ruminicola TaxID=839 RepID=UPI0012D31553|nr:serine O-acetyltransferase [Xylanibacter ruminicola]